MFKLIRVTIVGILLGIALILLLVNFNSVKERVENLVSDFNKLPESFSLANIFDGFGDSDKSIINDSGYTIKVFDNLPNSIEYFYKPGNSDTLGSICYMEEACINAGYFLENGAHAGLLTINGTRFVAIAPNDKQLTHVVSYKDGLLSFIQNSDYVFDANSTFEFQSGPLVVDKGQIRTDLINASNNGNFSTFRSFVGLTEEGNIFIGITTKQVDLVSMGEFLKTSLGENITVMNLDGGSSISIYFQDSSLNSFGINKLLPNILKIR